MKTRKGDAVFTPERTCVSCRRKGPKEGFYRIVRSKDGKICLDRTNKAEGRGAYVCRDENCIRQIQKRKGLERAFRCRISDCDYAALLKEFD